MTKAELAEISERESVRIVITTSAPNIGVALDDGDYYKGEEATVGGPMAAALISEGRARLATEEDSLPKEAEDHG
jgi:hypothetical protein